MSYAYIFHSNLCILTSTHIDLGISTSLIEIEVFVKNNLKSHYLGIVAPTIRFTKHIKNMDYLSHRKTSRMLTWNTEHHEVPHL